VSPTVLLLVADDAHMVSATKGAAASADDSTVYPIHPSIQQQEQQRRQQYITVEPVQQLHHVNLTNCRHYTGKLNTRSGTGAAATTSTISSDSSSGFLFSFTHEHPNIDLIIRVHVEDKLVQYITLLLSFQDNNTIPSFHHYDRRFTHYFSGFVRNKRFDITSQELKPFFEKKYEKELIDLKQHHHRQSTETTDESSAKCKNEHSITSKPCSTKKIEIPMQLNIYIKLLIDPVPFPTPQRKTANKDDSPTNKNTAGGTFTANSGTFTISIQYNFSVTEGLLLFIGYALFVIMCFLIIPCCCVLTVVSASCIKRHVLRLCGIRQDDTSSFGLGNNITLQQGNNNNNEYTSIHTQTAYMLQDTYEELMRIFQHLDNQAGTAGAGGGAPSTSTSCHNKVTKANLNEVTSVWDMSRSLLQDSKYMSNTLNQTCSICLEDFVEMDHIRMLVSCKHIFHQVCIDKWIFSGGEFNVKQVCPICKCPI